MGRHYWECENCHHEVDFIQPELPGNERDSEQNQSRECRWCGGDMYFDEYEAIPVTKLITPPELRESNE